MTKPATCSTQSAGVLALPVRKRGLEVIHDPLLNKGSGFPDSERAALGLRGLVPPRTVGIEDQVGQAMENVRRQQSDLDRYLYLENLHDCNETLYYRVLLSHLNELTPIIYTPVVGQACSQFGHIYQRARGMYFSSADARHFEEMVGNWPEDAIEAVVVTDGSRILGLGDLGANGMGIPIGKLSLYVLGAGLHPRNTLPVLLDMGTNNQALREDPFYLGQRIPRLTGDAYDKVVEAFMRAVHARWPDALIQFEDFSNDQAFRLLERYRHRMLCFNDDIQGTGAVTLAGILSALRVTGQTLTEQRVVFLGAGAAARGIADTIVAGMRAESGIGLEAARRQIWTLDSQGLVTLDRLDNLSEHKRPFAQDSAPLADLIEVIRTVRPTVLIGVSGQPGSFTEEAVREMHRHCARPILFPLSNPTSKAECTAEQAYTWTDGAALFASGSPFPPITRAGHLLVPGQCNNMYIFPGVGQGVVACQASQVTDTMFYVAARTLAGLVGEDSLAVGRLYPDLTQIREISAKIAVAVCELAFAEGLAGIARPDDLDAFIRARMFQPSYVPYESA
ncbi:NAD-dependent malic enzyme [Thiocystis violascens]|uniref:Malic enzyme n=1 Tax=Thiocystis violascens (strain ATCC 17096 / DSM 198 / 6111) TaxID=765911 RepID=I3YBT0_THIV6|nr:NAD-dependent malic enzyme [Thiocystis violascens]AFL74448.1 malic enzyme [Thiocystis violascens DSM 198]